jgi:hypothetical protein
MAHECFQKVGRNAKVYDILEEPSEAERLLDNFERQKQGGRVRNDADSRHSGNVMDDLSHRGPSSSRYMTGANSIPVAPRSAKPLGNSTDPLDTSTLKSMGSKKRKAEEVVISDDSSDSSESSSSDSESESKKKKHKKKHSKKAKDGGQETVCCVSCMYIEGCVGVKN